MKCTTTADMKMKISGRMKMEWVERRIQLELFHCTDVQQDTQAEGLESVTGTCSRIKVKE